MRLCSSANSYGSQKTQISVEISCKISRYITQLVVRIVLTNFNFLTTELNFKILSNRLCKMYVAYFMNVNKDNIMKYMYTAWGGGGADTFQNVSKPLAKYCIFVEWTFKRPWLTDISKHGV
jgi:hypothetical protein